jgi:hypothetical protein
MPVEIDQDSSTTATKNVHSSNTGDLLQTRRKHIFC